VEGQEASGEMRVIIREMDESLGSISYRNVPLGAGADKERLRWVIILRGWGRLGLGLGLLLRVG